MIPRIDWSHEQDGTANQLRFTEHPDAKDYSRPRFDKGVMVAGDGAGVKFSLGHDALIEIPLSWIPTRDSYRHVDGTPSDDPLCAPGGGATGGGPQNGPPVPGVNGGGRGATGIIAAPSGIEWLASGWDGDYGVSEWLLNARKGYISRCYPNRATPAWWFDFVLEEPIQGPPELEINGMKHLKIIVRVQAQSDVTDYYHATRIY